MTDTRTTLGKAVEPSGEGGPLLAPGYLGKLFLDLALDLVDREARGTLRRRKFLEGTEEFRDLDLGRHEQISAIFAAAGVLDRARIISYCGGGIAASGTSFALHLIGRGDAALYDGSLTDWAADPSRPMVTGAQ